MELRQERRKRPTFMFVEYQVFRRISWSFRHSYCFLDILLLLQCLLKCFRLCFESALFFWKCNSQDETLSLDLVVFRHCVFLSFFHIVYFWCLWGYPFNAFSFRPFKHKIWQFIQRTWVFSLLLMSVISFLVNWALQILFLFQ